MERNSFIFYKGWREAIKDLPDDVRLEIYESIIEYATTGNLRGLKPMANIAFNFIKIDIDRDTEKYMSIVERNKSNGSKGGRPKSENPKEPKEPTKPTGLFGNPKEPTKPDMRQLEQYPHPLWASPATRSPILKSPDLLPEATTVPAHS